MHSLKDSEPIAPGITCLPLKSFTLPPATHTNCYILGDQRLVVIDPASPIVAEQQHLAQTLQARCEAGARVEEIWLSHHHSDHTGGVEALRQQFNVPVAAHALTAAALSGQITIDRTIADGEHHAIPLADGPDADWQALHTPGHARGHLCFYEHKRGALFSGDNVVGLGTVVVAPPEGDMTLYLASLQRMMDRPLGYLLPSHGPVLAAARQRIAFYLQHRLAREAQVLQALSAAEPQTPEALAKQIYDNLDPRALPWAAMNVRAHLDKLVTEGRALRREGGAVAGGESDSGSVFFKS